MKVVLSLLGDSRRNLAVTFINDSERVAFVAKARSFEIAPDGDHLEFDPPAPYLGVAAKRGPYSPDELTAVGPGDSETHSVDLKELYELTGSPLHQRIRYAASNPLDGGADMTLLVSEWLELT